MEFLHGNKGTVRAPTARAGHGPYARGHASGGDGGALGGHRGLRGPGARRPGISRATRAARPTAAAPIQTAGAVPSVKDSAES